MSDSKNKKTTQSQGEKMSDSKNKKFVYLPDTELAGEELLFLFKILGFCEEDPYSDIVNYVDMDEIKVRENRLRLTRCTSEQDEQDLEYTLNMFKYLAQQPLVERPGEGNDKCDFKRINGRVSTIEKYCKKGQLEKHCKDVEKAVDKILPAILDWSELREMQAKNHPNWYKNLGKCTSLIFKVYQQQKGLESLVFDFMFYIEKFAIGVTLDDAPCNLDQAYEVCGYVRAPRTPSFPVELDPLPF